MLKFNFVGGPEFQRGEESRDWDLGLEETLRHINELPRSVSQLSPSEIYSGKKDLNSGFYSPIQQSVEWRKKDQSLNQSIEEVWREEAELLEVRKSKSENVLNKSRKYYAYEMGERVLFRVVGVVRLPAKMDTSLRVGVVMSKNHDREYTIRDEEGGFHRMQPRNMRPTAQSPILTVVEEKALVMKVGMFGVFTTNLGGVDPIHYVGRVVKRSEREDRWVVERHATSVNRKNSKSKSKLDLKPLRINTFMVLRFTGGQELRELVHDNEFVESFSELCMGRLLPKDVVEMIERNKWRVKESIGSMRIITKDARE